MIKQLCLLLLASFTMAQDEFMLDEPSITRAELPNTFPEQEVKIIPTTIDIDKLREEAYATTNNGERFLPGPSRIPYGLFDDKRKK